MKQLLLFRPQHQLGLTSMRRQFLDSSPHPLQRSPQSFGTIFQPARQIVFFLSDLEESSVVAWTIFPIVLVDRENVMAVEAPAVQFPQRQHPASAPIPVREWMNRFETMVNDRRAQYRRNSCR